MSIPGLMARQRPNCCSKCAATNGLVCESTCNGPSYTPPAAGGTGAAATAVAATKARPMQAPAHPFIPQSYLAARDNRYCDSIGAPYPCRPYMNPDRPDKVLGAQIPLDKCKCDYDEAVKRLCWVESKLVSPAPVVGGATIEFSIEVKWWFQIQKVINFGDQVNPTFEMTDIRYGQSNYNLEIKELLVNGVQVPQSGTDIRVWNFEIFDKFYPFPASALNDPVRVTFQNIGANPEDLELGISGPAILQIG